jgi:hypothetical protein
MGSSWTWPCAEREKLKYKPSIFKSQDICKPGHILNINTGAFQIRSVPAIFVNKELKKSINDYMPVFVSNHPINKHESWIIYQKDPCRAIDPRGCSYVSSFSYSGYSINVWKEMIENDIWNSTENGQTFLGILVLNGNYYIGFNKNLNNYRDDGRIRVFPIGPVNKKSLDVFLNQSGMDYCSFVTYKNNNFMIMQMNQVKKNSYFTYEFNLYNDINQKSIEESVSDTIEEYISKDLELKGLLIHEMIIYLIFKFKPI